MSRKNQYCMYSDHNCNSALFFIKIFLEFENYICRNRDSADPIFLPLNVVDAKSHILSQIHLIKIFKRCLPTHTVPRHGSRDVAASDSNLNECRRLGDPRHRGDGRVGNPCDQHCLYYGKYSFQILENSIFANVMRQC